MKRTFNKGSDPILLGVETSSPIFSVAVSDQDRILSFHQVQGTGQPSVLLTTLIQKSLTQVKLSLQELDGFTLSIGPGSFTGLRVGVMTVKTLAWALKKPVLPVSSLEVMARNLSGSTGQLCPFVDARKGKVYTALFSLNGGGEARRLTDDRLVAPDQLLKELKGGETLLGDGLKRFGPLVASHIGRFRLAAEESWVPRADRLCAIARSRWPAGVLDDPHRLVPQYLYSKESDITGW